MPTLQLTGTKKSALQKTNILQTSGPHKSSNFSTLGIVVKIQFISAKKPTLEYNDLFEQEWTV
jgi:hypothetical protein